jgi:hypothetical protein
MPIIYSKFKLMDYSIDGEEDSHSPRTQEKQVSDPQVLEKVSTASRRSSIKPLMKSPTSRPLPQRDRRRWKSPAVVCDS